MRVGTNAGDWLNYKNIFEALKLPALVWIGIFVLSLAFLLMVNIDVDKSSPYVKIANDLIEWLVPGWLGYMAAKKLKMKDSEVWVSGAVLGITQMVFIVLVWLVMAALGFQGGIGFLFSQAEWNQNSMFNFIAVLMLLFVLAMRMLRCVFAAHIGAFVARKKLI